MPGLGEARIADDTGAGYFGAGWDYRPGFAIDMFARGSRDLYNFDPIFDVNRWANRQYPGYGDEPAPVTSISRNPALVTPLTTSAAAATQQPSSLLIPVLVVVAIVFLAK